MVACGLCRTRMSDPHDLPSWTPWTRFPVTPVHLSRGASKALSSLLDSRIGIVLTCSVLVNQILSRQIFPTVRKET